MEVSSRTLNLRGKSLGFYTRNSFLVHLILICACVFASYQLKEVISKRKKLNLKLVQSSVRVDIVAMPKMTVKELKALEKLAAGKTVSEPEPKVEVKPPKVDNSKGPEFLKKNKKLSFAEMMKQYSKKKIPKKNKKIKTKKKAATKGNGGLSNKQRQALANLVKEGNQLKAGTSLTGSSQGTEVEGEFIEYINQVREWVKPKWKLPSYLMDKELNCRIRIYISSSGKLLQAEIFESSGNTEYDEKALAAVKASNPFPRTSNDIKSRVVGGDIVLGFPL